MRAEQGAPGTANASWQSRFVSAVIRAYMRPHVLKPIDPLWVRRRMGRQQMPRDVMVRSTGVQVVAAPPSGDWRGGEIVSWPHARSDGPVLLYLHGGGYLAGSPETHRPLVASLVRRLEGAAFVPDYRLAPEHPYPAALDDARAAYGHLLSLGIAPARIVIAGDSAGGGLALALTLALRDTHAPLPAAVVTFSPWTDLAATGRSIEENTDRCAMFAGITIHRAATFYLGASNPRLPYISPLYGEFAGMPPLLVHASEDEVLRDDAVRVAERARAAGVDVELRLWQRVPHVWQFFPAVLPEAAESLTDTVRFITDRVRGG
ncbi:MAG: alpha/beta hydrolase [Gemmatimonadaceae bacterium]|nr:alpha/beta hydrolase [Gemmatimonadaceae bacterium]